MLHWWEGKPVFPYFEHVLPSFKVTRFKTLLATCNEHNTKWIESESDTINNAITDTLLTWIYRQNDRLHILLLLAYQRVSKCKISNRQTHFSMSIANLGTSLLDWQECKIRANFTELTAQSNWTLHWTPEVRHLAGHCSSSRTMIYNFLSST